MNYVGLNFYDTANGDGIRVSLFVSGCRMHCKGCFNQESWSFYAGEPFTEETKAKIIDALGHDYVSGFSLLGGEPFEPEHEAVLDDLLKTIKVTYPDKTIWAWTGKTLYRVQDSPLLQYIDVLVDGPYIEALADKTLKYRGSSNQEIHYLYV